MGFERDYKKQVKGIWKESVKKDFWYYKRKRWYMENQNKRWIDELIRYKNIINHIKAQLLSWFGHLHRIPEERMVKEIYKWKPMLTRLLGRPKNRSQDDIRNYMKKLKIKNWTSCIQEQ